MLYFERLLFSVVASGRYEKRSQKITIKVTSI